MASKEQKRLMLDWYRHTGFAFMRAEDVKTDDPERFLELWGRNVEWLRDLATEADSIVNDYRTKCYNFIRIPGGQHFR